MLVKHCGPGDAQGQRRYSPSEFVSADKRIITGNPEAEKVSTSCVERQNLTTRMGMRHFTRLTNGFSKKVQNLEHAVALHFLHYNCANSQDAARDARDGCGISDHVLSLDEIAALAD